MRLSDGVEAGGHVRPENARRGRAEGENRQRREYGTCPVIA